MATNSTHEDEGPCFCGTQASVHADCHICGHHVTTHPDDAAGGLAYCGDCGRPTCSEHREDSTAQRCHSCTTEKRAHEATAVAAYMRTADAGLAGKYFTARYPGECALTHAMIKPYMQIVAIGDGAFVRKDAVSILSIRGNDSIETVLDRFGWANPELAAQWLAEGSVVLLFTASTLKPKVLRREPKMGCVTLDKVTALYWRSVAFMVRRPA